MEWRIVVEPEKVPRRIDVNLPARESFFWPEETKLIAGTADGDSEEKMLQEDHCRQPIPLETFLKEMETRNEELAKREEPLVIKAELIAGRLYTGPMCVSPTGDTLGVASLRLRPAPFAHVHAHAPSPEPRCCQLLHSPARAGL